MGNRLVATGVLDVPLMGGDWSYDRTYSEVGGHDGWLGEASVRPDARFGRPAIKGISTDVT